MIIIKEYLTESEWRITICKMVQQTRRDASTQSSGCAVKLQTNWRCTGSERNAALFEMRNIPAGGLRVYFAEDGDEIILLLGGGQKDSQTRDIENASNRLVDYLTRKEQKMAVI